VSSLNFTETEKTANIPKKQVIGFGSKDRLGSTIAVFDHEVKLKETHSFDPFGKVRKSRDSLKPDTTLSSAFSTRGFTDHEHMDNIQMIHMNGRGYDYNLGRFLSVDPFIVDPGSSQAINPYTYILNNPLSGTDPTGYRKRAIDFSNSPGNVRDISNDNKISSFFGQTKDGNLVVKTNGGARVTVSQSQAQGILDGINGTTKLNGNLSRPNVENVGDDEQDTPLKRVAINTGIGKEKRDIQVSTQNALAELRKKPEFSALEDKYGEIHLTFDDRAVTGIVGNTVNIKSSILNTEYYVDVEQSLNLLYESLPESMSSDNLSAALDNYEVSLPQYSRFSILRVLTHEAYHLTQGKVSPNNYMINRDSLESDVISNTNKFMFKYYREPSRVLNHRRTRGVIE